MPSLSAWRGIGRTSCRRRPGRCDMPSGSGRATRFIRASIAEVESTVYEAFFLVIVIIFLFLRDWRVTLIPIIVIPVSLIGAFFIMYVAGFSINVLTMLAVVL